MLDEKRELEMENRELALNLQSKDRVIAPRDRSKARTVKMLLAIIGGLCLALLWLMRTSL